MPAIQRACPFCAKVMRSDHLKQHLKGHQKTLEENCPNAWMKLPERNMYVNVVQRKYQADAHFTGVCLDCYRVIDKTGGLYSDSTLRPFQEHACREQGVACFKRYAPSAAAAESPKSQAKPDYEELWDTCRSRVMNMRKPAGADADKWAAFKAKMTKSFTRTLTMASDDDEGTDYAEAIADMMGTLAYEIWEAGSTAAPPATNSPAPAATSPAPPPPPAVPPTVVKTAQPIPATPPAVLNLHPGWPASRSSW